MAPPPNLEQLRAQIQFPGMPKPESEVFREWLERHGAEYDLIEFNVRVGAGGDNSQATTDDAKNLQTLLTQKRIDVVAWKNNQPTIIEVKVRANLGAVGQLKGYYRLFPSAYPNSPYPQMLVIARRIDQDAALVHSAEGIDVILYEDQG